MSPLCLQSNPQAMQNKSEQISALVELNEELENYFSNTIIPQLFVDAQLVLRKFTPPAMKQFRLKEEDIGKPLTAVRENFRFPTIIDNVQAVIATGEILEKEIQTTDLRWYQMNVLPYLVRKQNKVNGVIITFVDITERIKDLKEQEKLIAEHELLLDTISHDIKNPLATLSMSVELLKKLPEKGMEKFPQLLGNLERSLAKMKMIIDDLMQARWDAHPYQAVDELLDIQNIVEDVRLTLAPQIQESKAVVHYELDICEITFARRKLRSIVYNLMNNAIKYSAPSRNPVITVKCYKENGYLVISVADNGIGIAKEHQQSIFRKYQRIQASVEGNGVGLYLIKEILDTAGGKITVESELGKGSVFSIFLKLDEKRSGD